MSSAMRSGSEHKGRAGRVRLRTAIQPRCERLEARRVLNGDLPAFDFETARALLDEGQKAYSRLDLAIVPAWASAAADRALPVTLLARPKIEGVASLVIEIDGSGIFASADRRLDLAGPWAEAGVTMRDFALMPQGTGAGSAAFQVSAIDGQGQVVGSHRLNLFAEVDADGRLFGSTASAGDVAWRRLEADLTGGRITTEEAAERSFALSTRLAVTTDEDLGGGMAQDVWMATVQAPGAFTVQGHARWLDRVGGLNPIPRARVSVYDLNVSGATLVTTGTTDDAGFYSLNFTHQDEPGQGNPDLFVRIEAFSPFALVKHPTLANAYAIASLVALEVEPGTTLIRNVTTDNSSDDVNTAFSVHSALVHVGRYVSTISSTVPSQIPVNYPVSGTVSFFDDTQVTMNILQLDRWDWDVLAHEYGHYLSSVSGFGASPGGSHDPTDNLSESRGSKTIGLPLAFDEGWGTFFGVSALRSIGASVAGDPSIGDTVYDDTEDQLVNEDLEASVGLGEDNEVSVMGTLWDLYDSQQDGGDTLAISDKELLDLMKANAISTIGGLWNALLKRFPNIEDQVKIGTIFENQKIAPRIASPASNAQFKPTDTIQLSWFPQGGGPQYRNNVFNIRFFKPDWTEAYRIDNLTDNFYTLSQLEVLVLAQKGQAFHWVVEGRNTANPVSPGGQGFYMSPPRSFALNQTAGIPPVSFVLDTTVSMSDDIVAVGRAMAGAAAKLLQLPEEERPMVILVQFKDEVFPEPHITNDIQLVVDALNGFARGSGGGDCPENALDGLAAGSAWLMKGSKLYFATDASIGGDLSLDDAIEPLVDMGIEVHVLLTGDCEGMAAPKDDSGVETQSLGAFAAGGLSEDCGCNGDAEEDKISGEDGGMFITPFSVKPGDDGPPSQPVDDPGQPAPDDHGDTIANATRVTRGGERVRGVTTGGVFDTDMFRVALVAGRKNRIFVRSETGNRQDIKLFGPDGITQLFSTSDPSANIDYTPTVSGDYFISIDNGGIYPGPNYYSVRLAGDGLFDATRSSVVFFSQLAAETGGMFTLPTNFGGLLDHHNALRENVARTMLGDPVVWADTGIFLPIGQDTGVILRGQGTNWAQGRTTLEFLEGDIQVKALTILGPDRLLAVLNPAVGARQSMRDVRVVTLLGENAEVALGSKVLAVKTPNRIDADPRLNTVTPDVLRPGQTQRLQLWGNFRLVPDDFTVRFGPEITVLSRSRVSESLIELEVAVAPDADTGYRRLRIGGMPSPFGLELDRAVYITRQAEIPRVTSISPNLIARTDVREVELKIANFTLDPATASADFGPGITVESFAVVDPTTARARVRIAADAPLGRRRVDITSGERTGTLINGFTVDPGDVPLIDSILPISGDQGQTLPVTIRVSGLALAPGATASFGDEVTVEQLDVLDPTTAIARVRIAPGASLGGRDVAINSGGVTARVRGAFQVDAPPAPFGVPSVSVSPTWAAPGTTFDLTFTGTLTRFSQADSVLEFFQGRPGVTVNSFTVLDPLTAVANITLDSTVAPRVGGGTITTRLGDREPQQFITYSFQIANPADPRIDSVSPNKGQRGQDLTIRVETTNLDLTTIPRAAYTFGPGMGIMAVNALSPNVAELSVRIFPNSNVDVFPRTLRINVTTNPSAPPTTYTFPRAFSVVDDPTIRPFIASVSPAAAKPGDVLTVQVDVGTMTLATGASALFGPGVTVESFEIVDPDTARLQVRVAPDAGLGPRDLRVSSGNATATRITAFNVIAAARSASPPLPSPAIKSIDPVSARQGDSVTVNVMVENLALDASATFDFGPGIAVQSIEIVNASSARVRLLVDSAAALGARQVRITSQGSAAALANAFTVQAQVVQPPAITSISPSVGSQGQTVNVTIQVENLPLGSGTSVEFGDFVNVAHIEVLNDYTLIVQVDVEQVAPLGVRTVTVRSGGLSASLPGGFNVMRSAVLTPVIQAVSPASGTVGKSVEVVIDSRDTAFVDGVTTADFGPGIQVDSLSVTSPTRATVRITIAPGATLGPRTIRLTTGTEIVETAAFAVIAAPTDVSPPTITGIERFGFHARPTVIDLIFSEPLDPVRAGNLDAFTLLAAGRDGRFGTADDRRLALRSLGYDAATRRVTLRPERPLPLRQSYMIIVDAGNHGLRDLAGNALDGDRDGSPGGDAVIRFGDEALRIPTPAGLQPLPRYRKPAALHRPVRANGALPSKSPAKASFGSNRLFQGRILSTSPVPTELPRFDT